MADLVVSSTRVVTPQGVKPASVVITGCRIEVVAGRGAAPTAPKQLDVENAVIMPGIVDGHVHINEPGRTAWEGFASATTAAAAGGVTTVIDMPLNSSPVTTTPSALEAKRAAARDACVVDYGFWGGIVPGNTSELEALIRAGVRGFKCFLVPSGIDEFPASTEQELRTAMPLLAQHGVPLLVHAEAPGRIENAAQMAGDPRAYRTYLASRPPEAEHEAIQLLIRLCREFGCRVHIVHLSSAGALNDIEAAKTSGLPLTVETCPHYLTFAAEDIPEGATTFKCAPPIRERGNREQLWTGLRERIIDLIATDHSPCPPDMKCLATGDFITAWGGVSSLQLLLSAVWTEAVDRGHDLCDVGRWLCEQPAQLAGIHNIKGRIAPGWDADLVIWNPEQTFTVSSTRLYHRHKLTPYEGRRLRGTVLQTFLRGMVVFDSGRPARMASGREVSRGGV